MATAEAFIFFCEDTREEVGNKISFMGQLGPRMIVPQEDFGLKGLCIVALCRFREQESARGKLIVEWSSDRDGAELPPLMNQEFELGAADGEPVWQTQVIAGLVGLKVHAGLRASAKVIIGDCMSEATLQIDHIPEA